MPVPHDYYGHGSHEPHLHNRHNGAPYIEPDWQANIAKDQLPDLSTIGRGPRGEGIFVGNIRQNDTSVSFDILSDLTGEVIATVGPFPTGSIKVYGDPIHDPVAGEEVKFYVDYNVYDATTNKVKTVTEELTIAPGAMGSLIYLYPDTLDRTNDDTYQINEKDLTIYNRKKYPEKPAVRVNDIVFLKTHKRHPAKDNKKAWDEYWLTFGTVEAVKNDKVIFTARTFYSLNSVTSWEDIEGKPTQVSYFENDANYQNAEQVQEAIGEAVEGTFKYVGQVAKFSQLPSNPRNGDVYQVNEDHDGLPAGTDWVWSDKDQRWDEFGGSLSAYAKKADVDQQVADATQEAKDYTDDAIDGLTQVAKTGQYEDLLGRPALHKVATSGKYSDLSGKPNLATVATTGNYSDLSGTPNLAPVATSGNYSDLSGTPNLATVATSGKYSDLSGKPTKLSQFTNDPGYQTAQQVQDAIAAADPNVQVATNAEVAAVVAEVISGRGY